MTEQEFGTGWALMTAQPWGKPYREGGLAQTQAAFYWKHLKHTELDVWEAVSQWAATGDHWPSIEELKRSIRLSEPVEPANVLARNATIQWQDAPWPLQIVFNYQAQHHTTVKEAALAVLPQWLQENRGHEDRLDAENFLQKARNNFGMKPGKRGNIRCIP